MRATPTPARAHRAPRLDNARDLSRFRDWDADLDWFIEHERQRGATRQPDLIARGRQHNGGAAASANGGTNRGALLPADDSADNRSAGGRNPEIRLAIGDQASSPGLRLPLE